MIQATLVQLDNYGPWTATPSPRPEMELQALQARLYADLADAVGARDGYVFYARADNLVAVTNGLDRADHRALQERVAERYPVTASVTVGTGATPAAALAAATERMQAAGSAQDADRREVLAGEFLDDAERGDRDLQVAHFDVVDATGTYTDEVDAFAAFAAVQRGYDALMRHLYGERDALSFFVGGDNVVAVCPVLARGAYERAVAHVREAADVSLQVGVGTGATAREAGMAAKHALEDARETGDRVVLDWSPAPESRPLPADDD